MKVARTLCLAATAAGILAACDPEQAQPLQAFSYPAKANQSAPLVLATSSTGVKAMNGGYGSGFAFDPADETALYFLTDRGPNVEGTVANSKVFAKPDFTPLIGKFRFRGDSLVLEGTITLKNAAGTPLNGLPNPANAGGTGETAYDTNGGLLAPSADGLDPESLVRIASDGSFWTSDEYGPHIVHFDKDGRTLERINPFGTGTGGRRLPAVLARRRANRGMEGLTITPDGKTLVGTMQSTLYNPGSKEIVNKKLIRLLFFDLATAATRQYVYLQEADGLSNCDIAAITDKTFLVLERDGEFPKDAAKPAVYKRVYKIDIGAATDVSDAANGAGGRLYGTKTLEQLTTAELAANGVVPVTKTLVSDLLKDIPDYAPDKPEGLAIINSTLIAVVNDDDFGILDNGTGGYKAKILPATNKTDKGEVHFIKLTTPLK